MAESDIGSADIKLRLRFVRTFVEVYEEMIKEIVPSAHWKDPDRPNNIDDQINEWIRSSDVLLYSVQIIPDIVESVDMSTRRRTVSRIIVYEELETIKNSKEEMDMLGLESEPLPVKEGAKSPTVLAVRTVNKERRTVQPMAGMFGVPEGYKLRDSDSELAPSMLLSPDLDLSQYKEVFLNIKE